MELLFYSSVLKRILLVIFWSTWGNCKAVFGTRIYGNVLSKYMYLHISYHFSSTVQQILVCRLELEFLALRRGCNFMKMYFMCHMSYTFKILFSKTSNQTLKYTHTCLLNKGYLILLSSENNYKKVFCWFQWSHQNNSKFHSFWVGRISLLKLKTSFWSKTIDALKLEFNLASSRRQNIPSSFCSLPSPPTFKVVNKSFQFLLKSV